jgi:hypothetical protein
MRLIALAAFAGLLTTAAHAEPAKPRYPINLTTVPSILRGSWDEIVSDKCADREARYSFDATTASNFEVRMDVDHVRMLSPTTIDIGVTAYDENKDQTNTVWHLEVLDGGKTLRFRDDKDATIYRKCPAS